MKKYFSVIFTFILVLICKDLYAEINDIQNHWAKNEIMNFENRGFINGYSDNRFLPDKAVSRAEFISILNKSFDLKKESPISFSDVKPGDWYYKDVSIAVSRGYVKGYEDGSFRPNEKISRIETALMLARVNNLSLQNANNISFLDKDVIPSWAKAEVNAIINSGIMRGYRDGSFGGKKNISRAEAVVSMYRMQSETIRPLLTSDITKNNLLKKETTKNTKDKGSTKEEKTSDFSAVNLSIDKSVENKNQGNSLDLSDNSANSETSTEKNLNKNHGDNEIKEADEHKKVVNAEEGNSTKENTDDNFNKANGNKAESAEVDTNKIENNQDASSNPDLNSTDSTDEKKEDFSQASKKRKKHKKIVGVNIEDILKNAKNKNMTEFEVDGEIRTILWVKGINPPNMKIDGTGDFRIEKTSSEVGDYIEYKTKYMPNNHWYDVNKAKNTSLDYYDTYLCYAGVASNLLHWWLEQNDTYVSRFINQKVNDGKFPEKIKAPLRDIRTFKDSFKNQQDSKIYTMFTMYFGGTKKGFYSDLLVDLFINGFTPKENGAVNYEREIEKVDERGGFFHDVFDNRRLTNRMFSGSFEDFGRTLAYEIADGKAIGMEHQTGSKYFSHIVTLWGAEYNEKGELTGVYYTDTDDQDEGQNVGMKRFIVRNISGKPQISTNVSEVSAGSELFYIHTLSLGQEYWESYFEGKE